MPTELFYVAMFGLTMVFAGSAAWGLWWAIRHGQFSDLNSGAASIFDADEPIGRPTDSFPGEPRRQAEFPSRRG